MRNLSEIRDELSPEDWLTGLRSIRQTYQAQLVQLVADYAVLEATGVHADMLQRAELDIRTIDARVQEIDERLGGATEALGLNRAARRRLDKQLAKDGKRAEPVEA